MKVQIVGDRLDEIERLLFALSDLLEQVGDNHLDLLWLEDCVEHDPLEPLDGQLIVSQGRLCGKYTKIMCFDLQNKIFKSSAIIHF